MLQSKNSNIVDSALKGFSWNVAGNATRSMAGFIINILLARLLGPGPFGVVAIALLIIGIGNLIIDSGLGSALIQKEEIGEEDIAFVFTLQMVFSIGLSSLVILLAPWISVQFSTPEATPVIQVMALILVLQAFAQVPSALLRRNLYFQKLQISQISSFLIGYLALGLPLAFGGFGVWSLVAAQVTQSGLNALMVYFFSRHSLALTLKGSKHLAFFGLRILAANIANWIIQYIDQAIVGRQFGAQNLGLYSRAFFLNSTPMMIVVASAQTSLFSAVSRMGNSRETARFFSGFMSLFALLFFSIYWLIALESTNIIKFIYGPEWLPAAALLSPLAFAMPFFALVAIEGPLLNGLGKPHYEMWAQWATAIFAIITLIIASNISLLATAWSISLIYIFRLSVMSVMTTKALAISWKELIRPMLAGVGMGIITLCIWLLANHFITIETAILLTFVRSAIVLLGWMLALWLGRSWLFLEYLVLINSLFSPKASPISENPA